MSMKKSKIVGIVLSSFFLVASVALTITINSLAKKYDAVLRPLLGTSGKNQTKVNYTGVDLMYNKSPYTKAELIQKENELSDKIASEGIVVLEKGNIPYNKSSTKMSLFSKSSVDFVFGGTGSGAASGNLTLKSALEKSGFAINEDLWNFYKSGKGKRYSRGIGSINYGDRDDFSINEVPLSVIQGEHLDNTFSQYNTGVFVLSRTGGEGNDLARGMSLFVDTSLDKNAGLHPDSQSDMYKTYLEPDSIELEVMQYINDTFDDFILIVNCNNAMDLSFVSQFDKLRTIVQVPATGENGIEALGKILAGDIASSGRLVDTLTYDPFSHPASQNIGDFEFLVDGKRMSNLMGWSSFDGLFYMHYDESIYVGYRYFETRYEDSLLNQGNANYNNWKYEDTVMYPFGYGDSIAEFGYENFSLTEQDDKYIVSVDVRNTGSVPGKHTVELYMQAPYGDYEKNHHVEKASIELVDFNKTGVIPVGQSETVTFTVEKSALKTYMSEGNGQYYIPGGTYRFTVGKDAHAALNNILKTKGITNLVASPSEDQSNPGDISLVGSILVSMDTETYKYDEVTNEEVKNQFDFVDARTYDANHKYLSRSDWQNTMPTPNGEISNIKSIHSERTMTSPDGNVGSYEFVTDLDKNSLIYKDVVEYGTHSGTITPSSDIKWKQSSNLDFVDLRGLDITDPRYDEIVDKMSLEDAVNLFSNGGYQTASITSINKPHTFDTDGPAGFNTVSGHNAIGYSFPASIIIAQTWNKELMHKVGEYFGIESIIYEINGWYAPTANIHRSPFGGRNFEYFSEDPVLTGEAAKQELHGAASYGLFSYLKHFALNDQETHREKENGVCIFAEEQSIRELYLKAFEKAIKNNTVSERYYELQRDENKNIITENGEPKFIEKNTNVPACTAVMSSFSRLGGCWAGACYPLLNNVLQEEWGYHGVILTDYYHNWFMNKGQSLLGGGTCVLDPQDNKFSVASTDLLSQHMLKIATKNTLYAVANSNSVNNYIHGVKEIPEWANYQTILVALDIVMGVTALILGLNVLRIATNFKFKRKKVKVA